MSKHWILAAALAAIPVAAQAQPALAPAQVEIDHLLDFISHSNCRFNRNGSWHGMDEARSHISMKYGYLRDRGEVPTAEAFIENAASKSSLSGKNYLVECPGQPELASEAWLKAELRRYRKSPKG